MTNIYIEDGLLDKKTGSDHIQFMPFNVKFNGETEIKQRFNSETEDNKARGCLENSFRGYPLEGERSKLPEGYSGLVLDTGVLAISGEKEKVRAVASFDEFTYWNYDRVPTGLDSLKQALQWTKVAEALHQ